MQIGNLKTVYELIKREDGTTCGIGNSLEVESKEAEKLVKAGTHKFEDKPLGASESSIKKPEEKELKQEE